MLQFLDCADLQPSLERLKTEEEDDEGEESESAYEAEERVEAGCASACESQTVADSSTAWGKRRGD